MDALAIRIENLREALRMLQRCIGTAVAASLSLFLLQMTSLPQSPVPITGLVGAADPVLAKLILFAAYIASGFVGYAAVLHIVRIARSIDDGAARTEAMNFPTIATLRDPVVAFFGILLSPLLYLISVGIQVHASWPLDDNEPGLLLGALFFGLSPYIAVYLHLRKEVDPKPEAA